MSSLTAEQAINKFENIINDVLKRDLQQIELRLQEVNSEISDLIQQKHTLKVVCDKNTHPNGFKTQVNLGCNFFMEASVPDTSKLLVNVGLNIYVELTSKETLKYLDVRIKAFEKKAEELRDEAAKVKAHIKLLLCHIGELQSREIQSGPVVESMLQSF